MTDDTLKDRLRHVYRNISAYEYPQTHKFLEWENDRDFDCLRGSAIAYVSDMCHMDETKPMSGVVADFVEEVLEEQIENGDADSALELGGLYYDGRIGEQNFTKAVELYHKAADMGSREAVECLGYCYYYGRNIPIDYAKAYECFAIGALEGQPVSLFKIGDMYKNGYHVAKDEKEAFRIYRHCLEIIESGKYGTYCEADVYMRLADCYAKGTGTKVDLPRALKYYQKAERRFYDRLKRGDFMYRNTYKHCIEAQQHVRELLQKDLPQWVGFEETSESAENK